jgi:hypothetical protein
MKPEPTPEGVTEIPGWQVTDHDGHVRYRGTDPELASDLYQALPGGHLQQLPPPRPGPRAVGPRAVGPRAVGPPAVGPRAVGPPAVGPPAPGPPAPRAGHPG